MGTGAIAQNMPHATPMDTLRDSHSHNSEEKIFSGRRMRHAPECLRLSRR